MSLLEKESFSSEKRLESPHNYAIPLVEKYLSNHKKGLNDNSRLNAAVLIALSSISADWKGSVRENPSEVKNYLDMVIQVIQESKGKVLKNVLSEPIFSVLDKIEDIPAGREVYCEIFEKVDYLCQEESDLTRLSSFISSGGEYPKLAEGLDS
jgi:hypothetical protein